VTTFKATGLRAGQTSYYLLGGNHSVVGVGSADGSAVARLEYTPAWPAEAGRMDQRSQRYGKAYPVPGLATAQLCL